MADTLSDLESDWLTLRDMYAASPQLGNLRQAVEAGKAFVDALRREGQDVPEKVADDLSLLEHLAD